MSLKLSCFTFQVAASFHSQLPCDKARTSDGDGMSSHPPLVARDTPSPLELRQAPQKGSVLLKQETNWVSCIKDRTNRNHFTQINIS